MHQEVGKWNAHGGGTHGTAGMGLLTDPGSPGAAAEPTALARAAVAMKTRQ